MATIAEANAINVLLRWTLNQPRPDGAETADALALDAARFLAERAQKALHAGLTPGRVTELWTGRTPPKES